MLGLTCGWRLKGDGLLPCLCRAIRSGNPMWNVERKAPKLHDLINATGRDYVSTVIDSGFGLVGIEREMGFLQILSVFQVCIPVYQFTAVPF